MLYARIFQLVVRLLVAGFLLGSGFPSQAIAKMQGHFSGEPILQPTGDGRNMRLVEDFSYTDANGATWTAQKGTVTDGASIPTALWPIIGSPFTGKYLNAAIIMITSAQISVDHGSRFTGCLMKECSRAG